MDLSEYVDDVATLYGIAENAASGAVLRCGADAHFYIDGLSRWDDGEQFAAFEVTGALVVEGSDADLHTAEGGIRHGIGKRYVMKNAVWERIP